MKKKHLGRKAQPRSSSRQIRGGGREGGPGKADGRDSDGVGEIITASSGKPEITASSRQAMRHAGSRETAPSFEGLEGSGYKFLNHE